MDCIVQPQSHLWTGTIPHGLPSYHQRSFFPNFYFPRKRSFSTSFYPGPSMFFLHDDDVDYPTEVKGELAQTIPYHGMVDDNGEIKLCVVCGERASGFYFGALVCLPCKSFYIRCTKDGEPTFTCQCSGNCDIVKQGRIRCQYCRYQRCLMAGMCRKEKPETVQPAEGQVLCKVCGDIANGIHFGVNTCEGCKKFFRRGLVENQSYICKGEKDCGINPRNRNNCRYCRYQKCLSVGMSREAIKMGRPKKGDGSEVSCNITSSPKGIRQPLVALETNQSTNPHLGEDNHDTLKTSSVSSDIKEESLRSSCDFEKKMSNVWNQGQGQTSASQWQPCSQGHIVAQGNQGQSSTTVTSSEFIEEEMDEILMMLQNDNQSGGPAKKMRYDYNQIAVHKTCKSEFGNGVQGPQWGTNEIGNHGMSLNEPMNMTAGHINHVFPRPPPQYPGYTSGFQQDQSMTVQTCMAGSPCHSPNSQSASPGGYISDSGLHSPGYVPNGSPARSPGCQYSPQHSPMYQHSPSPHSPYQSDASSAASPYHEPVYQNSPYSPQDSYQVTDLSANVNCGSQNMRLPRSPQHNSLQFNNQMTNLSSTSPTTTIPLQEGGVNSQDGWCLTGFPSLMCHSPSHNTTSNMTIPHQEGINRRSSSRLENLQKINNYFMSPTSCNLQLVPDSSHDGTMTRNDIEEEVVHKTLASVSPAESFYYVLSDNHSCSSDSNCSTNYDEFTSCQRLNKRKACDNAADMYLRSEGSNIGRYQANLSRKYWQASVDREMMYPMTSERQTLLEHLSKIFQQMCDRYTEPAKQLANQDSHCWQQIQLRIVRNTSAGVKFASQIPGFSSLHPEDKAFLCKNVTFMSTLLMAGQHLYSSAEKNFRDFWNWQITPQNPFYPFKEQLVVIGEKIHALGMDVYEVSAMAALLFMASDFLDFAYPEAIEEGRRKIIGALKSYELSKGVDVQSRLTSLFSIAPEIRHVGMWHHELMKQMKINVQKQEVHQLFDAVNYRES